MSPSPRKSRRSLSRSLKERRASQKPDHLHRESGVAVGGRELRLEREEASGGRQRGSRARGGEKGGGSGGSDGDG